jgi:hypothetical protein
MGKPCFDAESANIALQYDNQQNPGAGFVFPCLQAVLDFLSEYDMSDCFFRGQPSLWKVVSSLHRHYKTERWEKACNTSNAVVGWLLENAYINNVINNDITTALAIAQHYGCPTDFVDVTTDLKTAAYFAASNAPAFEHGCIWVFTNDDIEELREVLRTDFFGCFSGLPQDIQEDIVKNDYSQLIKIDIPQLSRLNAQSGAFLWDVCGLLPQQLSWRSIGIRFVFKHTQGEKDVFVDDSVRLFPFPNQLESEIMRILTKDEERSEKEKLPVYYGTVQNIVGEKSGELVNGFPAEMYKMGNRAESIPFQDAFIPSFGGYEWGKRNISEHGYKAIAVDKSECTDAFMPLRYENVLELVEHIIAGIETEALYDYLVVFYVGEKNYAIQDEQFFIEPISTLMNYRYTAEEIATVIFEMSKIAIFTMDELGGDISHLARSEFEKYYGCKAPLVYLSDGDKYNKFKVFLPETYSLLEGRCEAEYNAFDKSGISIPPLFEAYVAELPENSKISLYQSYPRKIISYERIKQLFLDMVLPQQFFFPRGQRIYIPDYITTMALSFIGREVRMFE